MLMVKFESILENVTAHDSHVRVQGWNELGGAHQMRGVARADGILTPQQYATLCAVLGRERENDVRIAAVTALLTHLTPSGEPPPVKPVDPGAQAPTEARFLGEWFWTPVHVPQPGFVFGLSDPYARRRDEDALIQLGRFLPTAGFPHIDFQAIWMSEPDLESTLGDVPYGTLVFIARLNLYGPLAVERWKKPDARYMYPATPRPNLELGELCPEWHRVIEHQRGKPEKAYITEEKMNGGGALLRTDYAIVQRYSLYDGFRWVTVFVIAGASALGTLGAVMWATTQFLQPVREGMPIPVPPGITPHSCLEALLEIEAPVTQGRWKPRPAKLLKLNVDRAAWDITTHAWHIEPPAITLVYDSDRADEPKGMLFDGRPAPVNLKAESFRILARLCAPALTEPRAPISFGRLAGNGSGRLNPQGVRRIKRQLRTLKSRYLGEGLILNDKDAQLAPAVIVERAIDRCR